MELPRQLSRIVPGGKETQKKSSDLNEYREFRELMDRLDKIKRILPPDHSSINRNMLQLNHALKKSLRESTYDHGKVNSAYFLELTQNSKKIFVVVIWIFSYSS